MDHTENSSRTKTPTVVGFAALAIYANYALFAWRSGNAADALWVCHLGVLAMGLGLLFRRRLAYSIGSIWILFGNIFWMIGLCGGVALRLPSFLSHAGGLVIAIYCLRYRGLSRYCGVWAWLALIPTLLVTANITDPALNVNLVFRVWPGFERYFPDHRLYLLFLAFILGVAFLSLQWIVARARRDGSRFYSG